MKVLFVSAVLPYPLHSGGQIRIYNLLKRLGQKHEIHLFAFIRSEEEKKYLPKLSFCKSVHTVLRGRAWQPKYLWNTLTGTYPLLWSSYHSSEMLALLSSDVAGGNYNLIHIEPGYVWPAIPTEHRIPIVIAEHNIEHRVYSAYTAHFSLLPLKPFLRMDVAKMKRWEQRVWKEAAHVVTVSESDRSAIGQANVSVVPNGVDTTSFVFRPKKMMGKPLTFLYVGNFRWMENRDAAEHIIRDIWPVIRAQYPDARLRIVGDHAPGGQYYVGRVDDIHKEFEGADILLAPIRIGGGTKYKILEAMASGLPVITSSLGIEGMDTHSVLIAHTPEEAVQSVHTLENNTKRMQLVERARHIIEKEYSWDMIARKLDDVWNSLS